MQDHCAECHFDGRTLALGDVVREVGALPDRVGGIIDGADDAALRRRPADGSWSAIEYLGHLRDLMAFHRWLIERALSETEPVIDDADPDAAVADANYVQSDVATLLPQFTRRVTRLCDLVASLDDRAASRRLTVRPAQGKVDVVLVARSALHEGVHHCTDLERLLRV